MEFLDLRIGRVKTTKKRALKKTSKARGEQPPLRDLARLKVLSRDAKSSEEILQVMAEVMQGNGPAWLRGNIAIELAAITYESMNPTPEIEELKKRIHSQSPAIRLDAARKILERALNNSEEN